MERGAVGHAVIKFCAAESQNSALLAGVLSIAYTFCVLAFTAQRAVEIGGAVSSSARYWLRWSRRGGRWSRRSRWARDTGVAPTDIPVGK